MTQDEYRSLGGHQPRGVDDFPEGEIGFGHDFSSRALFFEAAFPGVGADSVHDFEREPDRESHVSAMDTVADGGKPGAARSSKRPHTPSELEAPFRSPAARRPGSRARAAALQVSPDAYPRHPHD